jgi:DNA topoisomerase I
MPRKIMIVESPSKAPKLESMLGRGQWRVLATKGHICAIDDGLKGLEGLRAGGHIRFKTTNYKFVKELKTAMREESTRVIYVATDDDREGEAIGYHACRVAGLDARKMPRLRFNAIERTAVEAAVANPGIVDMALVEAQMCRQAIDLALGYTASPLLWKGIGGRQSLSAGRCQTPALTLVCEQHAAATTGPDASMVWATETYLPKCNVPFRGSPSQRTAVKEDTETQLVAYQEGRVVLAEPSESQRPLPPPKALTTARMQQQCGLGTKRCMSAAQKLYEAGAITYHRTDAHGYCAPFAATLSAHITQTHGADNVGRPPVMAGGAHEAIRATDVTKTGLGKTADERRLYKFIRCRTVASGMAACVIATLTRTIAATSAATPTKLRATAMANRMVNPGWTLEEASGTSFASATEYNKLTDLKAGVVEPVRTLAVPTFTGEKAPLTEAKLVKTLETAGVGRPSTFASIVNKLYERHYAVIQDVQAKSVECEEGVKRGHEPIVWTARTVEHGGSKGRLTPTPLGVKVEAMCKRVFEGLLDVETTAAMETRLDVVAGGGAAEQEVAEGEWRTMAVEYWDRVNRQAEAGKAMIKADRAVASAAAAAAIAAGEPPPPAASATTPTHPPLAELEGHPIHLRHGRYGPYLSWNGSNVKILGRKMPNGDQAAGFVRAHLAKQAQVRDLGEGVSVRPGKKGGFYGMVTGGAQGGKGKKVKFVNLKDCPVDLGGGDAGELRAWIMSQV